jgi:hypothetical protein
MASIPDLQKSLPNFPEEILNDWLLPYAKSEGWPPAPDENQRPLNRWRYLLQNKPLSYWQSLKWEKLERHISISELNPEAQGIMADMVLGALKGQVNLYSRSIPNLKERFSRIVGFIAEYGKIPKPPALIHYSDGLGVLDGNHRMAAYFYCYGYFIIDPGSELMLKTESVQQYWVAKT